jgi:hypothetical protein
MVTHIRESRRFESMYTLHEKPYQYATRISRSVRIWSQTIHISHGQGIATFCVVVNKFEQIHCPWEEGLLTPPTARHLTNMWHHTKLLTHNNQWGSGEKTSFVWQPATRLTGPISLICNQYVQYLLVGANSMGLNRHRRGATTLEVSTFHIKLLDLVNRWFSTFHLRVSPILRLSNLNISSSESDVQHLSPTCGLSTTQHLPKPISIPSNG